jgi:hypothetical protein
MPTGARYESRLLVPSEEPTELFQKEMMIFPKVNVCWLNRFRKQIH